MELVQQLSSSTFTNSSNRCPRCNGHIFHDGDERWCLQCGYRSYIGRTLSVQQARLEVEEQDLTKCELPV